MATFHLINFGCRASQADGAALKRQLLDAGLEEVSGAEQSHVAVLNTCTVTATADAEVRQVIRRIHRANPQCRILVTGCYAQRSPEEIAKLPGVAWVVGNSHKRFVADLLGGAEKSEARSQKAEKENSELRILNSELSTPSPESRVANPESRVTSPDSPATVLVGEISEEFHFAPVFPDDCTRPTLKIQDGCDARCSFCIIPEVRGASRSLPPEKVIEQVRRLEDEGYQEIVLSGINLGGYGKDLQPRLSFLGILERILTETSLPRVRISSIEPMDVSAQLIGLVAGQPRLARHFHVPLQSGSDRILRQMNRRYWASHYAERIRAIHEQIPNCGIGADVMVGFPGETDADHEASLRFVASLPFTYLHVFPYSSRPGTPAAARDGHLNGRIIHERGREMRALVAPKRQAFLESQVGRTIPALTLDEEQDGARVALSSNYLKLLLPGSGLPANRLVEARVGRIHEGWVYAYADAAHPAIPA
ncbi:MAG: tRNA (N(6)-L-threonylcarbamoyladenosine(37)-C(2))-methylthiotransferase MtaB [Terriglobia bacterium]